MAIDKTTHGFGTLLKTGTWAAATPETVPGTLTSFGELVDLDLPKSSSKEVTATKLNQANKYHRFRKGFINAGELRVKVHFDKTDFNTLLTYDAAGTEVWWVVCIPEPDDETHLSTFAFHGFVKELGASVPEDDGITAEFVIKVNGKPQFTAYT
jgi:hypothetical protein